MIFNNSAILSHQYYTWYYVYGCKNMFFISMYNIFCCVCYVGFAPYVGGCHAVGVVGRILCCVSYVGFAPYAGGCHAVGVVGMDQCCVSYVGFAGECYAVGVVGAMYVIVFVFVFVIFPKFYLFLLHTLYKDGY